MSCPYSLPGNPSLLEETLFRSLYRMLRADKRCRATYNANEAAIAAADLVPQMLAAGLFVADDGRLAFPTVH